MQAAAGHLPASRRIAEWREGAQNILVAGKQSQSGKEFMAEHAYVQRVVDLLDPSANILLNMSLEEARRRVAAGRAEQIRQIDGQFALLEQEGKLVRMARSIGRPMRYFLAKRTEGPCLVVAERIDEIHQFLQSEGLANQFHPSYTRMVPAHYLVELALLGCPDPNPVNTRYFTPPRNRLSADLDEIGRQYIGVLAQEIDRWLASVDPAAPVGVLFSGGVDSGAVLLVVQHCLRVRGDSLARLKAFTLAIDGGGDDLTQAREFLEALDLGYLLEPVEAASQDIRYRDAVAVIEDYKPLDVQSATMALALCRGIRCRYPDWKYLVDGDGGDENLKDYPIEENPELTIRSVLNNPLLYQEGWGVEAVKHSLTYSGGQSRGHVRTYAPARNLGFVGFSPFALPNVIEVAEGIPFVELTDWNHDRLYALKGEIVRRGVRSLTGLAMPVFAKRRFQHGASPRTTLHDLFPADERAYRRTFAALYE